MQHLGMLAQGAARNLAKATLDEKNFALQCIATQLEESRGHLLKANDLDLVSATKQDLDVALLDRLKLSNERIDGMLEGLQQVINLDDPITYCESLGVDVAFSQGTIWPPKVYDKLGVVLCCGFFYLRSSPQTIELLESWQSAIQVDCDDQKSLNELLMDKGLAWPVKEDYVLIYNNLNVLYQYL